jgi:hypothetical protein
MKTGIICYSHTHNNLILAGEILARTGGTLLPIEELKKRTRATIFLDLFFHRIPGIKEYLHLDNRFDHYILISPVWGGKIASPLRAFLLKEGSKIKSYSFISVCGGEKRQVEGLKKELTRLLNRRPVAITQLPLSDLCKQHPADVVNYRIKKEDLQFFQEAIDNFVGMITRESATVVTA